MSGWTGGCLNSHHSCYALGSLLLVGRVHVVDPDFVVFERE